MPERLTGRAPRAANLKKSSRNQMVNGGGGRGTGVEPSPRKSAYLAVEQRAPSTIAIQPGEGSRFELPFRRYGSYPAATIIDTPDAGFQPVQGRRPSRGSAPKAEHAPQGQALLDRSTAGSEGRRCGPGELAPTARHIRHSDGTRAALLLGPRLDGPEPTPFLDARALPQALGRSARCPIFYAQPAAPVDP
jgi:hypothetical protein